MVNDMDDLMWGVAEDPSPTGRARLFTRDEVRGFLDHAEKASYRPTLDDDSDALYLQLFLFNDKQNHAADPEPFKIAESALDRIAWTAIGRPWIVHPDGSRHVRGASDNPADIIKHQKQFAKGEIVAGYRNLGSNNVHMIAKVFPEFKPDVKAGKIPKSPYLSPLIYVKQESGDAILDAEVLHVQSVDAPGYEPEIAKISGMCEGMLNKCMTELRTLGAAGKLKAAQNEDSEEEKEEVGWELEESFERRW
jgi:hypothetical protein